MQKAHKNTAKTKGLKIPVSAVQFRLWAPRKTQIRLRKARAEFCIQCTECTPVHSLRYAGGTHRPLPCSSALADQEAA
jgi:hypothetical protein